MRLLERLFVALNGWAVILCMVAMSAIVFSNVTLRGLTNHSIPWADEVARYLMIWMTFLGAGLILRHGGHVAITNLQEAMASRAQIVLRAGIVVLLLGFFGFMVWVGWDYMQRMRFQRTPATRISFIYIYAAMPVGFSLLIVHLLLVAKGYVLAGPRSGQDEDGAEPEAGARG
ncbi:MAG: TRAP transporter small permease [Gemmobacter sp.]